MVETACGDIVGMIESALRRFKYLSKVLRMKADNRLKFEFVYFSNAAGYATATVGQARDRGSSRRYG